MSIRIAGGLVKQARKEALEEAAKVVDREADRIMRQAHRAHDAEDPDYDEYERLECLAGHFDAMARRIRNRAKRRN